MNQIFRIFSRNLRKNQTDSERKLWYFLRNRQFLGLKFRRQYKIGKYIVDFCCVEKLIVIELDGGQHHENDLDKVRDEYLRQNGYRVLRFWDHEMLNETNSVLEKMQLELKTLTLDPSPRGRGKVLMVAK